MKLLIFSSVVFLLSFTNLPQTCDDLKFDVKVTNTTNGQNNGKLDVTIIKSSSKIHAYLYGDTKSKNKLNVGLDDLINLESGTYTLVLQNNECSAVKQGIEIK